MSKFHKYSLNNVMLIHSQKPDATLVAGRKKWQTQFQRNVLDSQRSHGIEIIAPASFNKTIQTEKLDVSKISRFSTHKISFCTRDIDCVILYL